MVAFHKNTLSSLTGLAEHPLGGSAAMARKSLASRSIAILVCDADARSLLAASAILNEARVTSDVAAAARVAAVE